MKKGPSRRGQDGYDQYVMHACSEISVCTPLVGKINMTSENNGEGWRYGSVAECLVSTEKQNIS